MNKASSALSASRDPHLNAPPFELTTFSFLILPALPRSVIRIQTLSGLPSYSWELCRILSG